MRLRNKKQRIDVWRAVAVTIMLGMVLWSGGPAFAEETSSSASGNVALQVTSWLLTAPYGTFKAAYAIGGSIVGGIVWLGTGGDTQKAKSIWRPAITGDYIIRPENLAGQRPLHFVGKTD
ncbi:MAG: hypothetical protein NNA21_04930 [Nitrospira sp.]|nr:hypothetical protein [Nitrospira sp.]MCP9461128.1 hypothetical protein [Nitrospira sp.]MCP9474147.1 hypothetical protein [Nitrospira sp.]